MKNVWLAADRTRKRIPVGQIFTNAVGDQYVVIGYHWYHDQFRAQTEPLQEVQ